MLEFPAQELRKYFKMGDHVKVIAGRFEGDTGLIVRVEENFVILFSDLTMHEVSAWKSMEEASGTKRDSSRSFTGARLTPSFHCLSTVESASPRPAALLRDSLRRGCWGPA
jgi:hypothetical protein